MAHTVRKAVDPNVDIVGWLRANCPELPCIVPHWEGANLIGLEKGEDAFIVLIPDKTTLVEKLIKPDRLWFCNVTANIEEFLG